MDILLLTPLQLPVITHCLSVRQVASNYSIYSFLGYWLMDQSIQFEAGPPLNLRKSSRRMPESGSRIFVLYVVLLSLSRFSP